MAKTVLNVRKTLSEDDRIPLWIHRKSQERLKRMFPGMTQAQAFEALMERAEKNFDDGAIAS